MNLKMYAGLGLLALVGCVNVPVPKNATLKTADGPLVQAHRGGRFEYDDNAAGGFSLCLAKGIRGFETDVRFSKDQELVVMHDSSANRTTDGVGKIEEHTLAELRKFRLQACSEPIPTAEEVFRTLNRREDVFIEIEMKSYPDNKFYTPDVLTNYCRKLNAAARANLAPGTFAFTSFNTGTLETMRGVDPDAPLGLIVRALKEEHIAMAKRLRSCSVAATLDSTEEMVREAYDAGLTVCLWMVQNAEDYAEAKDKGADRVTSDYPHLLDLAVRGKRKKLVAMDLDATLCQHRSPIPEENLEALKELGGRYKCIMVGAGNAPRIHFAGPEYNKYDATLAWAKNHGYKLEDIVFIGDDFADGGGDSHVRIKGMDHIVIKDYKNFANAVSVLLK